MASPMIMTAWSNLDFTVSVLFLLFLLNPLRLMLLWLFQGNRFFLPSIRNVFGFDNKLYHFTIDRFPSATIHKSRRKDGRKFAWNWPFAWLLIRRKEVSLARAQQVQILRSKRNATTTTTTTSNWNDNHVVIAFDRAKHKVDYSDSFLHLCSSNSKNLPFANANREREKNQFLILICGIHEIVMFNVKPWLLLLRFFPFRFEYNDIQSRMSVAMFVSVCFDERKPIKSAIDKANGVI